MKIISIEGLEVTVNSVTLWVVAVTVFNFANGEGVVIPFAFDAPEDSEDAIAMFSKIAELQGGEASTNSPFSSN